MKSPLLFLTIASFCFLFSGCDRKEDADCIKNNLPEYLYEIDVRNAAGAEKHGLINELGRYADKQEKEFKQSMMGIGGLMVSFYTSIYGITPKKLLDDYTDRQNEIVLGNMGRACDMACKECISSGKLVSGTFIPSDTLFRKVLGTPLSEPSITDEEIDELLKEKILCNMPDIHKRLIEKCKYKTRDHLWEVIMNDGLVVYVRVVKKEDGTKEYIPILPDDYIKDLM